MAASILQIELILFWEYAEVFVDIFVKKQNVQNFIWYRFFYQVVCLLFTPDAYMFILSPTSHFSYLARFYFVWNLKFF